jgi:hypothetical protein
MLNFVSVKGMDDDADEVQAPKCKVDTSNQQLMQPIIYVMKKPSNLPTYSVLRPNPRVLFTLMVPECKRRAYE